MRTEQLDKILTRSALAQYLLGGIGLALVTIVCFPLGFSPAAAGFAYLILIAPLAMIGSFIGSIVISIVAVACLSYFFAPPLFNFRMDHPEDALVIVAFLTTSIIVSGLMAKVRRMAEEAQASQQALVDSIPALVWSTLPDGSRDFHSQRWLEFTGLTAEEAIGQSWTAVHPQDRPAVVEKWRSAVATGEPFEVEARGRSAIGEYRWFLVRACPLRDETGTIVKWYGVNTDIEDRKRAIEALRESEEQWREVFEHNPVMYFMIDAAGTALSVNTFGAAKLGYEVSELVGQSVLNVFFEEDREFVRRHVAKCLEEPGQPHSWEVRKIRKDGTVIWVSENAKAVLRPKNQMIVLIACEDITEQYETGLELSRLASIVASSDDAIISKGLDGRVTSWNAGATRVFGYQANEMIGQPITRIIPSELHAQEDELLVRLQRGERAPSYETVRVAKDGRRIDMAITVSPLLDKSGKMVGASKVGRDITERKQAEKLQRELQAELAHLARVATLGELTASIAHEVNQPLAGVVSSGNACLHWLASEPPNIEKARKSVDRLINDANRASEVVGRVRGLARKAPLQRVLLNVNETVLETLDLTRTELEQHRVSLNTQLSDDVPLVWADRTQLQQVILNLIMNAIEAVNAPGNGPRDVIVSTAKDKSEGVLLSVRDSGTGLDPGKLEDIFDAFYTTKRDGMGMGLAVSRSIIEAHGGCLRATPNEPRGAVFQFTLPIGQRES